MPSEVVENSTLLKTLLTDNNTQVILKDSAGAYHFNGNFTNADSLKNAMSELPDRYANLVSTEEESLLDMFEDLFDHKSFTGRSGTFFGFEGLGSIYWHMVSKLALAVQEVLWESIHKQSDSGVIASLENITTKLLMELVLTKRLKHTVHFQQTHILIPLLVVAHNSPE